MYQLKDGADVVAQSADAIEYHEDQKAWFADNTWYCDSLSQFTVEEVADQPPAQE